MSANLKQRAATALGIPPLLVAVHRNTRKGLVSVGKGFRCGRIWAINTDLPFGTGTTLAEAVADLEARAVAPSVPSAPEKDAR